MIKALGALDTARYVRVRNVGAALTFDPLLKQEYWVIEQL